MLFFAGSTLHQASLDTHSVVDTMQDFAGPGPGPGVQDPSSVAVDIATNEVYWADRLRSKIFKANLAQSLSTGLPGIVTGEPREVVSLDLVTPEVIALDWISRLLFWVDSGTGSVEVLDLVSGTRRSLVTGLAQVTALAVDVVSQ